MYDELREKLASLCGLCYARGHVSATNGNVSARTPDNRGVVIKASGVSFANLTAGDMLFVSWDGDVFECDGPLRQSARRASIELHLHLNIYEIDGSAG